MFISTGAVSIYMVHFFNKKSGLHLIGIIITPHEAQCIPRCRSLKHGLSEAVYGSIHRDIELILENTVYFKMLCH